MKYSTLTDINIIIGVVLVHEFKKTNFNLGLGKEWTFIFDDFYSDIFTIDMIKSFDNLNKRKFLSSLENRSIMLNGKQNENNVKTHRVKHKRKKTSEAYRKFEVE